jgi:hypothetical protein
VNPRIREFAEQCTTIEHGVIQPRSRGDVYHFDKEKFAELIIRECAQIARHDAVRKMSGEDIADMIEMHFGVER